MNVSKARDDFRSAWGFLTTLGGASRAPDQDALRYAPVVGLLLGWGLSRCARLLGRRTTPHVVALGVVALDVLVTGGLHYDGLADSADGLLTSRSVSERLEIMRDPRVGTFGTLAVVFTVVARVTALGSPKTTWRQLPTLWCASRSLMALAPRVMSPAREGGLGAGIANAESQATHSIATCSGVLGLVGSLVLASVGLGVRGARGVLVGLGAGAGVLALAQRQIGGYTGDVLGAAGLVSETVGLIASTPR